MSRRNVNWIEDGARIVGAIAHYTRSGRKVIDIALLRGIPQPRTLDYYVEDGDLTGLRDFISTDLDMGYSIYSGLSLTEAEADLLADIYALQSADMHSDGLLEAGDFYQPLTVDRMTSFRAGFKGPALVELTGRGLRMVGDPGMLAGGALFATGLGRAMTP